MTTRLAPARRLFGLAAIAVAVVAAACAEIGTDPSVPASIEALPLAAPAIAIGDSLRDTLGVAQPVRAVVRNIQGDIIEGAELRYLYVQFARDSALEVDSVTGAVVALKRPGTGPVQIAARFANALQILIPVRITNAPTTAFVRDTGEIVTFIPDTGRAGADSNSVLIDAQLQYEDAQGALQNTADWLVRFAVVEPRNLQNDTTQAAFFLDDNFRGSQLDTSGTNGVASRRLRVRPGQFFTDTATVDTVEVEVMSFVKGAPIPGAPIRLKIPVFAPSTRTTP